MLKFLSFTFFYNYKEYSRYEMPDNQMLIINLKKPNRNIGIMYLGKILQVKM